MKRLTQTLLALACAWALTPTPLLAQLIFTFDENGNISGPPALPLAPGVLQPDPSGGLTVPVLVYTVPLPLVTGDLLLTEPGAPVPGPFSDVVRFWNPTGGNISQIIFYSDVSTSDPPDALADTGLPTQLINPVVINETGPEGLNGAVYNPPAGGPGALPGALVQYNIISDGAVPEPGTMALAGLGGGLMLLMLKRRQQAKN